MVTAVKLDGHRVKSAFSPAPGRPASRYDWIVQKKPILIDSSLEIHTGGGTVCPLKTRIPDTFTKASPCIQRCAPVVRRRSAIQGRTASFVPDTLTCCEGMRGPAISSGSTRRGGNSSWSERQRQCKLNGLIFHLMLDFNKFSISKRKSGEQLSRLPSDRQRHL